MPSRRPHRAPDRVLSPAARLAAPATLVGTWRDGTVHIWGWNGHHAMAPPWLDRTIGDRRWIGNLTRAGHHSSIELPTPGGHVLRAPTIRLPPDATGAWLRWAVPQLPAGDSLMWLGAVARLAEDTVTSGRITPVVRTERSRPVARWVPVVDAALEDALDSLAAAVPPIVLPDRTEEPQLPDRAERPKVRDIHAALVDSVARNRLADRHWRPAIASTRTPTVVATRAVFRALSSTDPLIGRADPEAVHALAARLDRRRRRADGEPVVLPRVRLVVPDDPAEPWEVRLEVVDELDPGRWCSAEDVWDAAPVAVELAGDHSRIESLATVATDAALRLAESVDILAELAVSHQPAFVELDVDGAERFLDQAATELPRLGIDLIGPEHLVRAGVSVRGTATPASPTDRAGRFSREAVVDWRLVVADEDGPAAVSEAELARAEAAGATLLHTGQRWVRIDPAALQRARARLTEHASRATHIGPVALLQLGEAGELEPSTTGGTWTDELLVGLPDDRLHEAREAPAFRGQLRPYQRRALGWLQFLERLRLGGCLADDMGLGKTATALAHLQERPGPHLVVSPLSVVHNWVTEAARFTPDLRVVVHHGPERLGRDDGVQELAAADLVVTTYGLLPRDVVHLGAVDWSTLVLDEAQMVKNPATRAAKAVRTLRAAQKLALTGTPVENRLAELWAILDAVNPGLLGSRERFRQRFGKPIERDGDADAAARLRRLTQPFVLRRSKADRQLVPDLPDKIEQVAWATLTREQAVLYQHVVDQLLADASATTGMRRRGLVLAALTRLKQICNHPAHALGDGSRLSGRSGKLARFEELVDELLDVDERALVFTQFREMGELLRRHCAERLEMRVPFLHGATTRARRDRMVAEFQAGVGWPLLLVSLKAGGTGLNLTAASQVIHYDRWWNPAVEDQATDRAWRIGQGRTVVVHKLVCEGTVEERIAALIDDKRALANAVVGSGEAWLSELSTSELRELVRLSPEVGS